MTWIFENILREHFGAMVMEWTSKFDLHSHSTYSDGEHSTELVASLMKENDVQIWSLTDHDTISGWADASKSAAQHDLTFIPGIEITCNVGIEANEGELSRQGKDRASSSWHLLAYFPQTILNDRKRLDELHQWLLPLQTGRVPRMVLMLERLEMLGMPIALEDVTKRAPGSLGRPHLAQAMVDAGYVSSSKEAFDKYIGDGGIAFVEREEPPLEEAIFFVHKIGGITSLAHPLYYGVPVEELIEYLSRLGCDAIEVFHRSHSDEYRFELLTAAKNANLGVTVGSDFHGQTHGHTPGNMVVTKTFMPNFFQEFES